MKHTHSSKKAASWMGFLIVSIVLALLVFLIVGNPLAFMNKIFNNAQDCEELYDGHCYEKGVKCEGGTELPIPDLCNKDDICITGKYDPGNDCVTANGEKALPTRGKRGTGTGTATEDKKDIEIKVVEGNLKQITTVCQKGKTCTQSPIILSENIGTVGVSDTAICYDPREEKIVLNIKPTQTEYLYHYILDGRNNASATLQGSSNKDKLIKLEAGKETEVVISTNIARDKLEDMVMGDTPVYLFLQTYEKDKLDAEKRLHKGVYEVYILETGLCKDKTVEREVVANCSKYNDNEMSCELAKLKDKTDGDCTYKSNKCIPEFYANMEYCGTLSGYGDFCKEAYDKNGEKCFYEGISAVCMSSTEYTA